MHKIITVLLILALTSCYQLERTSGNVLNNAGGVVKSGAKNLWIDPGSEQGAEQNVNNTIQDQMPTEMPTPSPQYDNAPQPLIP